MPLQWTDVQNAREPSQDRLAILFVLYRIFVAATEGVEKAMVADLDLAPENRRGTAFGWFNMVVGLALLPASVVFGVL